MKLTVIIPAYNEKKTLPLILHQVESQPFDKEIIIVDDCSTDGTYEYIQGLNKAHYKILHHDKNIGKGAALRTAQSHINGDIVIIQDADLEYQPEDFTALMKPILDGGAEAVYGTRFLGPHRVFYFWHYFGNRILCFLTNIFYNTILTDMECGYKAFRADIFKKITIRSNRFDVEPELTAKIFKRKLKVVEVPITYYGRDYHEGKKITWRDFFPAVWAIIKFRFVD